jgi:hypothetical protein
MGAGPAVVGGPDGMTGSGARWTAGRGSSRRSTSGQAVSPSRGRSASGQASGGAGAPRSAAKSMVGLGGWVASLLGVCFSSREKITPRHGSSSPGESDRSLSVPFDVGRPHSSTSPAVVGAHGAGALAANGLWCAASPVAGSPPRLGGRQVRQAPASGFQHLVHAYCRQSMQKWNVPANCSLEGEAVETDGASWV